MADTSKTKNPMIAYREYLARKLATFQSSGFEVTDGDLHADLFDFQRHIVKLALSKGRFAIFADCGLGKTLMQLEWARCVAEKTQLPVLILAPLVVAGQTIKEGEKFGIDVFRFTPDADSGIYITNYEQLENVPNDWGGIVLDESSILKNFDGKTRDLIIEKFKDVPYKLACTATPSPNDVMELGNHAEFLNVMGRNEMLSMFFIHDGGETAKWRLKGHAESDFWSFVASWSVMLARPQDLGFDAVGYDLPPLQFHERNIVTPKKDNGMLFNETAVSATNFNHELRITKAERLAEVADIVNSSTENFIVWVKQNEEADEVLKLIPDAREIAGKTSEKDRENIIEWFTETQCDSCKLIPKNVKLPIWKKTTGKTTTLKIGTQNLPLPKSTTQSTELSEINTTETTTPNIKRRGISERQKSEKSATVSVESDTPMTPNIEKNVKQMPANLLNESQRLDLKTYYESSMDSPLSSTPRCSSNSTTPVRSVSVSHLSSDSSNDSTLTTIIKLDESGDCSASTAITPSENSTTTPNSSNAPRCICGNTFPRRVIISKAKILGYGINFQNCHNQVFASLDFSFEGLYQAVRRSYRFGQNHDVHIYLITTDTMANVTDAIERKERQFKEMQTQMIAASNEFQGTPPAYVSEQSEYKNEHCHLRKGDCIELIRDVPSESVGFSIFSPPFASLYTYSDKIEDMGNCASYEDFKYALDLLAVELERVMWSGRNVAIHCMDLPIQKGKEGFIGLRDFSGLILNSFIDAGFVYHSRVTIWKNPVTEMQRTKALGLLHKQVKKDSAMSRVGTPDYLLVFRKDGDHEHPVKCDIPVEVWQQYASPVWMDIDYGKTLNGREGRHENDERHICPLQLETIERAVHLWSNEGDIVLTPFMGIGSEVYQAVKMNRKGIGFELKDSYFDIAVKNAIGVSESKKQGSIFDICEAA